MKDLRLYLHSTVKVAFAWSGILPCWVSQMYTPVSLRVALTMVYVFPVCKMLPPEAFLHVTFGFGHPTALQVNETVLPSFMFCDIGFNAIVGLPAKQRTKYIVNSNESWILTEKPLNLPKYFTISDNLKKIMEKNAIPLPRTVWNTLHHSPFTKLIDKFLCTVQ